MDMWNNIKVFSSRLLKVADRFKYVVTIVIGGLVVGFVGENSYLQQVKNYREITRLKGEIERFDERYKADSTRLSHLYTDPEAIEKIARERYFMKTNDEDIFVLSDDEVMEEPEP